jgi:hypothetical protein
MRKLIFVVALLVAVPTAYARECSDDTLNACYEIGRQAYENCMELGNSDASCTGLRSKLSGDCYRINNCLNN